MRDSFIFYRSFYEAISYLDKEAQAECFSAICEYVLNENEVELSGAAKALFISIKPQLDANNKRYRNGCKGGRGKNETEKTSKENQTETKTEPKENQKETEVEANENENENENENVNDNENEKINYQLIADMYNDTCVSFPRLTKLSDQRKKAIRARLKKYSLDEIKKVFEFAERSDFLKGNNNRNWSANFDWLINDSNMAKVLDGNYNNKIHGSPPRGSTDFSKFT